MSIRVFFKKNWIISLCREATETGNKPEGVARGNWIIPDILESEDLPSRSQPCPLHTQGSGMVIVVWYQTGYPG